MKIPHSRLAGCQLPAPTLPMMFGGLELARPTSTLAFRGSIAMRAGCGLIGLGSTVAGVFGAYALLSGSAPEMRVKVLILLFGIGALGIAMLASQCGLTIDTEAKQVHVASFLGLVRKTYSACQVKAFVVELDDLPTQGATLALQLTNRTLKLDPRTLLHEPRSADLLLLAVVIALSFGADLRIEGEPARASEAFIRAYQALAAESS